MTSKDKIARRKLSLLELASELSNVSRACKVMGYSRQQFYEIRRNFQTFGGVWQRHDLLTKHERLLRLEKATAERTIELTEEQMRLLERFSPEFRERHIEAPHTGSLVAVDTFFVGTLKGVGKLYLQTAIDCHSRYAWARLYPSKLPVTAVHLMNGDVIPTFEAHDARIETVLSDNVLRAEGNGADSQSLSVRQHALAA